MKVKELTKEPSKAPDFYLYDLGLLSAYLRSMPGVRSGSG